MVKITIKRNRNNSFNKNKREKKGGNNNNKQFCRVTLAYEYQFKKILLLAPYVQQPNKKEKLIYLVLALIPF